MVKITRGKSDRQGVRKLIPKVTVKIVDCSCSACRDGSHKGGGHCHQAGRGCNK